MPNHEPTANEWDRWITGNWDGLYEEHPKCACIDCGEIDWDVLKVSAPGIVGEVPLCRDCYEQRHPVPSAWEEI